MSSEVALPKVTSPFATTVPVNVETPVTSRSLVSNCPRTLAPIPVVENLRTSL